MLDRCRDAGVVGLVDLDELAGAWVVFGLELFDCGFAFGG